MGTIVISVSIMEKSDIIFAKEDVLDKSMEITHSKVSTSQERCTVYHCDQGIQEKNKRPLPS